MANKKTSAGIADISRQILEDHHAISDVASSSSSSGINKTPKFIRDSNPSSSMTSISDFSDNMTTGSSISRSDSGSGSGGRSGMPVKGGKKRKTGVGRLHLEDLSPADQLFHRQVLDIAQKYPTLSATRYNRFFFLWLIIILVSLFKLDFLAFRRRLTKMTSKAKILKNGNWENLLDMCLYLSFWEIVMDVLLNS
jgi:hypothetical protein